MKKINPKIEYNFYQSENVIIYIKIGSLSMSCIRNTEVHMVKSLFVMKL